MAANEKAVVARDTPRPDQEWFSIQAAAIFCDCSTVTLGREARRGRLKGYKLAARREWRFKREDLDAWMQASATPLPYTPTTATNTRRAS